MNTDQAYKVFLRIFDYLSKAEDPKQPGKRRYNFYIHHFVLMSNHYHLIVSVSESTTISKLLQLINSLAAKAINKILGRSGHVWGERFFSKVIDSTRYLQKAVAYIYQNPWKAKRMRVKPTHFKRSTLSYYLKDFPFPTWLRPDPELMQLSKASRITALLTWILSLP